MEQRNAALGSWSLKDDTDMLTYVEQGRSIEETAQLLSRPPEEVRARLSTLMSEASRLFPKDIAAS